MIFVNFKTYPNGSGRRAVELAKVCTDLSGDVSVIPVVQVVDLYKVKETVGTKEVWTQHLDSVGFGQNTGWVLPESVKEAGAGGVFLNHSEHKICKTPGDSLELGGVVERARAVGLKTVVFAADLEELRLVVSLKPNYAAYEPPDLIGSRDHSVAENPEVIAEGVEIARAMGVPFLVGAGIHSPQDVRSSLVGGAVGIAIARDILEAVDPAAELSRLIEGFTHPGVEFT